MKLIKYLRRKNYLLRLILTIAGFVCIPLIITQILMMERSAQGYAQLNEENIYENLQESTDVFSEQIKEMSLEAIKISQDTIIRKAAKDQISRYTIHEVAQRINEYSNEKWTTGVWFHDHGMVLVDRVNITPDQLYERIAGDDVQHQMDIEAFFEAGNHLRVTSTAEYAKDGQIIVATPISFFSVMEDDATVFFVMKQNVVEEDFNARFHDCSGVALLDSSDRFLVRSEVFSAEMCKSKSFQRFLKEEGQKRYDAYNGERRINIYKQKDVLTGYTCLVSIFEDNMETHLRQYVNNIRNILIVSIILMFLLLGLTVKINYKPVKMLANRHGDKATSKEMSELDLLDSAFFFIDQKVLSQKKLLTSFMISDLLSGKPVEDKMLDESFPENGKCNSMVIALNGPTINSIQSGKIIAAMKERCECDTYITGITYRPQILMVCVFRTEPENRFLKEYVGEILSEITGNQYNIGFGSVVKNITDIRASYLQSLTNSNETEMKTQELDTGVAEAIQKFGESLYAGDAENMQRLLDEVEFRLSSLKGSDSLRKYYCYKLLTVYFANATKSQELKGEMERLVDFTDTKQLFVMLRQTIRRLCVNLNENEQAAVRKLRKKLLNYVNVNYNNQNLCLTSVADYLETSIYVVSRLFKEATGKGFKEYITDKRLEYARELLQTTTCTVAEISGMSGFENTVYFSSVFKTKYGLPPTQYRKKHQKQQ